MWMHKDACVRVNVSVCLHACLCVNTDLQGEGVHRGDEIIVFQWRACKICVRIRMCMVYKHTRTCTHAHVQYPYRQVYNVYIHTYTHTHTYRFLNRLSDFLFMAARYAAHCANQQETVYQKERGMQKREPLS
jgi:hypothetical protein